MSAVRQLQIAAGHHDPFAGAAWPRLDQVMRGIKRVESESGRQKLKEAWSPDMKKHDGKMLWAACCLGFFSFLRAGEMTIPSNESYDALMHLSVQDISVDDSKNPSILRIIFFVRVWNCT